MINHLLRNLRYTCRMALYPRCAKSILTRGFSLIELSIVVAILSVVAALGLEAAANFVNRTSTSVSKERLQVVDEAVAKFYKIYGRLPCPDTRTAAPAAAGWGTENCAPALQVPNTSTLAGGGLYLGGVPWRTLNIPMMYSLDGFGSKFNYVVTFNLTTAGGSSTVANRFSSLGGALTAAQQGIGGIEVRTGVLEQPCPAGVATKCQIVADPSVGTGAAYFIFSSGADQRGAVSARGGALPACAVTTANTDRRVDANNCVFGSSTIRGYLSVYNGATYVASTIPYNVLYDNRYNPGMNLTSYYDDVAVWRPKSQL